MTAAALLAALALAAAPRPPSAAEAAAEAKRRAIADEMIRLGAEIQRAVEARDVEALLRRVPADGLRCGPRRIARARVERELRLGTSWLHGMLFGGPGFAPVNGGPASLRAFFAGAKEVAVLVGFQADAAAGLVGRPCLEYRAPDRPAPAFPLCFERRDGRWWFADSLYPCGGAPRPPRRSATESR